jgi:ribosomal protein S18 acetylase RimI-like enzyme
MRCRAIIESDLEAFKAIRLEALRSHPSAFGSDYDEALSDPPQKWQDIIQRAITGETDAIFVAEEGNALAGLLGVHRMHGIKNRHSALIWGVYVRPRFRGMKLVDQLMTPALSWCTAHGVRILRLSVSTTNQPAICCYRRCGFVPYGTSPQEIRIGEVYHDELLMYRRV